MLGAANNSTSRMLRLINDLLDLEKIKDGMMTLHVSSVSAKTLAQNALDSVPQSDKYSPIETVIDPPELSLQCDPDRIVQVLVNLLSNAQKFSPAETKILLRMRRVKHGVCIEVSDNGRGISSGMLSSIFEPFTQSESADTTRLGGSGLGLAVCKAITALHGGTIVAQSVMGEGTTFTVHLPQ